MSHLVQRIAPLLCLLLLGACSSVTRVYDDVMGGRENAPSKGRFYVGTKELGLYEAPAFSSKRIARLPLHEEVERTEVKHGFAHVRVPGTGEEGWVENARLLWRLPPETAAPAAAPAAARAAPPAAAQPSAQETAEQAPEPVAAPAAPQEPPAGVSASHPTEDGTEVNPALFDAF